MKKAIAMILLGVMSLSLLTGCGKKVRFAKKTGEVID